MKWAGILLAFLLVTTIFGVNHASAQTYKAYVQPIPQIWKKTFSNVLPNAIQYWKQNGDYTIELVSYSDKADFVVEWASQFDASKSGHYSTDLQNYYNKPKFTIPVGFIKNGKLQTVSPEFALMTAKHNLGHAIGLPHSDNPGDVMYPQVESYDSWLQATSKVTPKNVTQSGDWKTKTEKIQAQLVKKLDKTESAFNTVAPSINSTWTMNKAALSEITKAQDLVYLCNKMISDSESLKADADLLVMDSKYSDAYFKYLDSLNRIKKVDGKIVEITKILKKAISMEYPK